MFILRCWCCQNTIQVDGPPPETPLELARAAESKGWGVATDNKKSAWVCCTQSCHDNTWIKDGRFPAIKLNPCLDHEPRVIESCHL